VHLVGFLFIFVIADARNHEPEITKSLRILGRDSKEEPLGWSAKAFPLDPAPLVTHYTFDNLGDCRHALMLQKI
jgi:hypothetical protein